MFRLMLLGALAAAGWATVGGILAADSSVPGYVAAALADTARPPADVKIDLSRKPAETIAFAGVKPGMIVGEFFPGGGYFTRMLSAVIGASGHVYAIENVAWTGALEGALAEGRLTNVSLEALPFGTVLFPEPLDIVWITQNYHDLKIAQYGQVDTAAFNRAVFASLKPGGTYFILDHEAPAETDLAGIARLHRIEKTQVIREVTAAGFELAAEGTFLRRPSDDHTLPVFDKKIRSQTDQYALRFVKPR
ncbi:class I SAM-dependent methyltransferase [Bradyrhizobium erythrophlei]|uniref:Predicted methyltransferase n=1 Tax=Bradyrhizobium erythrophlei TaxID=1437360 RepID=A0A1M7UP14_9BRAD|nr:class I SAM-dependent methyltransferase [Bradyrhizobium erythrophlei]SHN84637.1 Predicted methyltransferase [Bradyrhizobium erythrophlei]